MWKRPARTRMMGWRTNDPTAYFAAGEPPALVSEQSAVSVTPFLVSDFRNGVYSLNGTSCTFADLWVYDTINWFAVSDPVPGTGIVVSTAAPVWTKVGPLLTDAVFAALDPTVHNPVVVMEFTLDHTGAGIASVLFEANNLPSPSHGVGLEADYGGAFDGWSVYNYPAGPISIPGMTPGVHRMAALLNLGLGPCAIAIDGGPATTGINDDDTTMATHAGIQLRVNAITVGAATATLRSVTIYPTLPLAELSTLSAL